MEIKVSQNILGENDRIAAENKKLFAEHNIYVLNLMGSPGAGKTSLLEASIDKLRDKVSLAVIEGDLFTDKDADRVKKYGVPVIQINTVGGCHLDANMVRESAAKLNLAELDFIIVENVGNLVCPAEFAIGEDSRAVVLSVTEGDDKPLKYPLMFKESAVAILNKIDILPFTNFDLEAARTDIAALNPPINIIEVSCREGTGIDRWCEWLLAAVKAKRERG